MSTLIHFLNVGHSDCIILESNGHFAMIDAAEDTDYPADKDVDGLAKIRIIVFGFIVVIC